MAWKAKLRDVPVLTSGPSDDFQIVIEFYDAATSRSFIQTFTLNAANFQSLVDVQSEAATRVLRLTKLDNLRTGLLTKIGLDL